MKILYKNHFYSEKEARHLYSDLEFEYHLGTESSVQLALIGCNQLAISNCGKVWSNGLVWQHSKTSNDVSEDELSRLREEEHRVDVETFNYIMVNHEEDLLAMYQIIYDLIKIQHGVVIASKAIYEISKYREFTFSDECEIKFNELVRDLT